VSAVCLKLIGKSLGCFTKIEMMLESMEGLELQAEEMKRRGEKRGQAIFYLHGI
jgi:hypothetical protein